MNLAEAVAELEEECPAIDHGIVLVSHLDKDGELAWAFRMIGDPYLQESLGLLEHAKLALYHGTDQEDDA